MDDGKVIIKNLKLEYISTKKDKYDNEYVYFKIKETNIEKEAMRRDLLKAAVRYRI